ncbi:NAD-dependent epimerase/dehydratase family protein [Olivibacter sp. XZL3]|uniref:NAD-dependent epimerase/dehydratase family protein n=1 Tax=Olivibacter sp. XZL3 TaxID=1735116 RepID=UPI0010666A72|nr:NAD-dependent epimerase/dehydratase family protein [Olivibacter sp. XZL3]
MGKDVVLVIGANGQVGSALIPRLIEIYGNYAVIASDIRPNIDNLSCRFLLLDATDPKRVYEAVNHYNVTIVYHLAAVLSANAERSPVAGWDLNIRTVLNVLEVAKTRRLAKVFIPSSIAVFGPSTAQQEAQQFSYLDPTTVYGISKVATENWIFYYNRKHQLDVRSIRYPGVIGSETIPSGGTTDYAVEMFYKGLANDVYTCYLKADTALPMIYMEDAIRATIELMDAPKKDLNIQSSYNVEGISFTPSELAQAIKSHIPKLKVYYEPDFRQHIAQSWPCAINDQYAAADWNWKPNFDLFNTVKRMIEKVILELEKKTN